MINRLLSQIQKMQIQLAHFPIIDWRDDKNLGMSVINVVTWDRAGLFYKLAGALTLSGLAILSTRAISRKRPYLYRYFLCGRLRWQICQ